MMFSNGIEFNALVAALEAALKLGMAERIMRLLKIFRFGTNIINKKGKRKLFPLKINNNL